MHVEPAPADRLTARLPRVARTPAALAAGGLTLLTLLLYGGYAARGPLSLDDWWFGSLVRFHSFGGVVAQQLQQDVRRPVAAVYYAVVYKLLAFHPVALVSLSIVEHLAVALALCALLRELRFGWTAATAIPALALVFPAADSVWLWSTAAQISFGLACLLTGTVMNLRAARAGPSGRVALRAGGLALQVVGILTYESLVPLALLAGALYLRQGRRRGLRAWAVDAGVLVVVTIVFVFHAVPILHGADNHPVQSAAVMREHARLLVTQSAHVFARSLVPYGAPPTWLVLTVAGVVLALSGAASRAASELRGRLRPSIGLVAAGGLLVGAGYLFYVPADLWYVPLQAGDGNRVNGVSSLGYVLAVFGLLALLATLAADLAARRAGWSRVAAAGSSRTVSRVLTVALLVLVAAGYVRSIRHDERSYEHARQLQDGVLALLRADGLPPPPHGSLLTVRGPLQTAPGIPVFDANWDLQGAVQTLWRDPTIRAYPVGTRMTLECGARQLSLIGGDPPVWPATYPVEIVDVAAHRRLSVASRGDCASIAGRLGLAPRSS